MPVLETRALYRRKLIGEFGNSIRFKCSQLIRFMGFVLEVSMRVTGRGYLICFGHKTLPSVYVIAWRVLKNRIATKVNLHRREIMIGSVLCCFCGVKEEDLNNFFYCRISWMVWNICCAWLDISLLVLIHVHSHFLQFRLCNAPNSILLGMGDI